MRKRSGFTIIEVSLFLAITALLFVGITVGTQNSINQQRYADSVNSFADFLRNIYSEVSNPQSKGYGNSDRAIYGKLVTFGESKNLTGENNAKDEFFVYDVVGDANGAIGSSSLGEALKAVNATVISRTETKNANGSQITRTYGFAGYSESYLPRWDSKIENQKGEIIKGSILVVRHPNSGTITTLVSSKVPQVNEKLKATSGQAYIYNNTGQQCMSTCTGEAELTNFEKELVEGWKDYKSKEVIFCVNPFGDSARRQEVKITKDARNSSGVVVVELDGSKNKCQSENNSDE